jgi:hypothetical protein
MSQEEATTTTIKPNLKELKALLKQMAEDLKKGKLGFKNYCRNGFKTENDLYKNMGSWSIFKMKHEFRHMHIAYCELRGRIRSQIEKPSENNMPDEAYINKIKEKYLK